MTSLFSGERVPKSHERIEACGELDELGSTLGALEAALSAGAASASAEEGAAQSVASLCTEIHRIQGELLAAGAWLATTPGSQSRRMLKPFGPQPTRSLEDSVERLQAALPPLEHFILAGGHPVAAWAHVARAVCRRAERRALRLAQSEGGSDGDLQDILTYLNRLSFYLFVLARRCNQLFGAAERTWQG